MMVFLIVAAGVQVQVHVEAESVSVSEPVPEPFSSLHSYNATGNAAQRRLSAAAVSPDPMVYTTFHAGVNRTALQTYSSACVRCADVARCALQMHARGQAGLGRDYPYMHVLKSR